MKIPAGIDPSLEFYVDYKPDGRMVFIQPKPKKVPEQKYKVRSHDGQCFKISKWATFFRRCFSGNQVTEANTRIGWTALSYSPLLLDMLDEAERNNINPSDIVLGVDVRITFGFPSHACYSRRMDCFG
jgi:hypothetical protein